MARRSPSQLSLSMFPFLSVLCAVIGILMLFMIAIITTRVVKSQELLPIAVHQASHIRPEETNESDEPAIPDERYDALEREVLKLADRLAKRQGECEELEASCRRLEELLKMKKMEVELGTIGAPEVGRPLGEPEQVAVIPDSKHQVTKKPIRIEVTNEGFIVHPERTRFPVQQLEQSDSPLVKWIAEVDDKRGNEYMLLLLHPNGAGTYFKLRKYLLEHHNKTEREDIIPGMIWREITTSRIDLGVEPFSKDWLLIPESESE